MSWRSRSRSIISWPQITSDRRSMTLLSKFKGQSGSLELSTKISVFLPIGLCNGTEVAELYIDWG